MSYILDAVRKADQERRENLTPVAHSLGAQSQSKMPTRSRLGTQWPAIVAAVLLLNVAGWYWTSKAHNKASVDRVSNNNAPLETAPVAINQPVSNAPAEARLTPRQEPTKMLLWQAPVNAQNAVRSLEFSFHVYANDSTKRTIIINGQRLAEKDRISQDLALSEITPSGVILLYQNNLMIEVEILEQW